MNYRLNQSYFTQYPLIAPLGQYTEFACYYEIDYTFLGRNYLTVDVLEQWKLAVKPIGISAAHKLPYDPLKTAEQNAQPDDRWDLIFQTQNAVRIGEWKAKSLKEQTEYVGLAYVEPIVPEANLSTPSAASQVNAPASDSPLKGLFTGATSQGKRNLLWLVLAGILTIATTLMIWAIRKTKKAKIKAEATALKYGKYTQNVADALT